MIKHGHRFIDNCSVSSKNLWQDGLHLKNSGKGVLLNNYVVTLNDNYFLCSSFTQYIQKAFLKPNILNLNKQCDNTLNNQVQVTKKVSINSVINNEKNWTEKNENPVSREIDNC